MEQRPSSLVIGVAGAGWNLVARIAMNGRGIASIDVVVERAAASSSFHIAETDLPTHSLNGPPVYGIHDRDAELMLLITKPDEQIAKGDLLCVAPSP
jgi:hypothetical protein